MLLVHLEVGFERVNKESYSLKEPNTLPSFSTTRFSFVD